jgi:hypothetical protein
MPKKILYLIILTVLIVLTAPDTFAKSVIDAKNLDTDNDGLTDYEEKEVYHTDWLNTDTDQDGVNDGPEVVNGFSPLQPKLKNILVDTDQDGLNDEWEARLGSDLTNPDTDGDGYLDGEEVINGYSPTFPLGSKVEKRIEIDKKNLQLIYFFNNIKLRTIPVSTGKASTPTPEGTFSILDKVPIKNYFPLPNTKWNLHFTTNPKNKLRYYIHGAYWHNLFGLRSVSGGCVNVSYAEMERLYNWAGVGTKVIIK